MCSIRMVKVSPAHQNQHFSNIDVENQSYSSIPLKQHLHPRLRVGRLPQRSTAPFQLHHSSRPLAKSSDKKVDDISFLLAYLVGLEVGPCVGNALYGKNILSVGWHSGPVFGSSASAAAASKLLGLPASQIEDALGIACTQACGLMSAQCESEVKRMQHGFAARNGLPSLSGTETTTLFHSSFLLSVAWKYPLAPDQFFSRKAR
jgi:hypothetical protein